MGPRTGFSSAISRIFHLLKHSQLLLEGWPPALTGGCLPSPWGRGTGRPAEASGGVQMGALRLAGGGGGRRRVWLREILHVPRGGRRWPLSHLSSPRAQLGPLHRDPSARPSPPSPWPHPCVQGVGRADPRADPDRCSCSSNPRHRPSSRQTERTGQPWAGAGEEEELGRAASSSRAVGWGGSHSRMMGCVCVDLGETPWDSQETCRQQVGPPVSWGTVRFAFKDRKASPLRMQGSALWVPHASPDSAVSWGCFPPMGDLSFWTEEDHQTSAALD